MRDYYPFIDSWCAGNSYYGGYMMIVWFILFGLILFVLFRVLSGPQSDTQNKALTILKQRYAKGEITKKEFEDMKKDLT